MKIKRISVWLIFLIIVGGILCLSTWRQWNDNQNTILERTKQIPPIAAFHQGASIRTSCIHWCRKHRKGLERKQSGYSTVNAARSGKRRWYHPHGWFSLFTNRYWIASKTFWTLEIWDATSGSRINALHIPSREFAISPESNNIVMDTNGLTIWDVKDPKNIKGKILLPPKMGWESLSLEGLERIDSMDEKSIIRHNLPNKYYNASVNHTHKVIDFSHNGKWIAAAVERFDETKKDWVVGVKVWDLQSKHLFKIVEREFPDDQKPKRYRQVIQTIDFSPDNRLLAAAGENGLTLWSLPGWEIYHEVLDQEVWDIAFSPDSTMYAVTDAKGTTLWSVETLTPIAKLQRVNLFSDSVIAFSPDGSTLAGGGYGGVLSLWDVRNINEK